MNNQKHGGFTLPGEAGYEDLTLSLAEKWGADVIRDSDGTQLSDQLMAAGFAVYATICPIRGHNSWLKQHPNCLQHTFLSTAPVFSAATQLSIPLLEDFSEEQFSVDDSNASQKYWQVWDRTVNQLVPHENWHYHPVNQRIIVDSAIPYHQYTASFFAYRIWEEISMYNHLTNGWTAEHLMPLDPIYPEAWEYLLDWLADWCETHPAVNVVRFTSLFYNFVWIWGKDQRRKNCFTDWASYDFTVSPKALDQFAAEYGYSLTAEDFIHQGKLYPTHIPPSKQKRDWMHFIQKQVGNLARQMTDLVHQYGKKAYVFYDDSWVGLEPYQEDFARLGFDGIIKAAFSGFEARLCAGVNTDIHELRLHPYLFPTGVDGSPSFLADGNPKAEAIRYWMQIRRALLRHTVDRIGMGGYLHLTQQKPDFVDYIAVLADEFRMIREVQKNSTVYCLPIRVAVLHSWGSLRSWTLSGHFHETSQHDLIHVLESLSGMPVNVDFIQFQDILSDSLSSYDVLINAGQEGDAWSGGSAWEDTQIIDAITAFVCNGGCLIGIGEPSALPGYQHRFRLAHLLGVDKETPDYACHGYWETPKTSIPGLLPQYASIAPKAKVRCIAPDTIILLESGSFPLLTYKQTGNGRCFYLSSFQTTPANTRLLLNLLLHGCEMNLQQPFLPDNPLTECAYYPSCKQMIVLNQDGQTQKTAIPTENGVREFTLPPYAALIAEEPNS